MLTVRGTCELTSNTAGGSKAAGKKMLCLFVGIVRRRYNSETVAMFVYFSRSTRGSIPAVAQSLRAHKQYDDYLSAVSVKNDEPRQSVMATVHERTRDVAPACGSSNRLAGERNMAILAAEHPASAVPRGAYLQSRAGVRRVLPPSCLTPSKAGTSPNDQLERPSPGLSPVIGPGATAFSSVASAFDFHHHVGTDPASELLVLKRILGRECVLSRLEAVCNRFRRGCRRPVVIDGDVSSTLGDGMAGVVDMLSSVRDATVTVVEAIAAWREDVLGDPPPAFMWHGENYLLKAINDLNFLAGVEPLVAALKVRRFPPKFNLKFKPRVPERVDMLFAPLSNVFDV